MEVRLMGVVIGSYFDLTVRPATRFLSHGEHGWLFLLEQEVRFDESPVGPYGHGVAGGVGSGGRIVRPELLLRAAHDIRWVRNSCDGIPAVCRSPGHDG